MYYVWYGNTPLIVDVSASLKGGNIQRNQGHTLWKTNHDDIDCRHLDHDDIDWKHIMFQRHTFNRKWLDQELEGLFGVNLTL